MNYVCHKVQISNILIENNYKIFISQIYIHENNSKIKD